MSSSLDLVYDTSRVHDLVPLAERFKCLLCLSFLKCFAPVTTTKSSIYSSNQRFHICSIVRK